MASGGAKTWWTAAELAEAGLPGLPRTKRKVNALAAEAGWAFQHDRGGRALARRRQGRGGGIEYHYSLLPPQAVLALGRQGRLSQAAESGVSDASQDQRAAWFEAQSDAVKAEAGRRLQAVQAVEALQASGLTRSAAVASVAAKDSISPATLWLWLKAVAGVHKADRLAALAPRRRGGGAEAEVHPLAWQAFKSEWLRPEQPTFAACYARTARAAAAQGWGELPHLKTLQRKIEREIDPILVARMRGGADALRATLPPQKRSVADFHALEAVNIDGHEWDVFVNWPGREKPMRPMMVLIQDLYSRKVLAWRIAESENAAVVQLVFADLFKTWGVPSHCYLDNGRAFASKWITGGSAYRFRGRSLPSDPMGLLRQLGVQEHFTLPYRGQSKPVERCFGDLERHVGTHPAFAGANTGNSPLNKPDNYGARAVDLDVFMSVVSEGIALHNAREGRNTETAGGVRSFDQVFAASYRTAVIRKIAPAQHRMALLAADKVRVDRKHGSVALFGNSYWTEELRHVAGDQVVVRFDPQDLHSEVHVYALTGAFIATAPVWAAVGFADQEAAQRRARLEAARRKKARDLRQAEHLLAADELAALLPPVPEAEPPAPAVIRPIRAAYGAAAALADPNRTPIADRFLAGAARLRPVE